MSITLTPDEANTIVEARDLLAYYLPPDDHRSGFEDLVLEQLTTIASEIRQPLVPAGSEAFMSDFLARLVDKPLAPLDNRARAAVEGRHLHLVRVS